MGKFTRKNQQNIEMLFESKTGVDLHPAHRVVGRKWILVTAILCCLALTSCGYVLFSPLNGDALALRGSYENGVVSVLVVNGSNKTLRFQEKVKLMSWKEGEIPATGGDVGFENTSFGPHSSGTMTIDLSRAYPLEELEAKGIPNDLYLVLTNKDFAFGQDWMCHFVIGEKTQEETAPAEKLKLETQNMDGIEDSLRFYFEDHYLDQLPAYNTANADYMVAVQEVLSRQEGTLVRSMSPLLLPEGPEGLEQQTLLNHHSIDSFNRMVGSVFPGDGLDSALMVGVSLPQYQGQVDGGIGDFKLLYYFTFPTQELKQEGAYAFVYGRILTFPEMEENKVYEDEEYTVYDLTDLFYTDVDQYLDDFVSVYGGDVYLDDEVRRQVHEVYQFYRDRDTLRFRYLLP